MRLDAFDVLIGLRLSIVRRAADMLVLHFGDIRPHESGEGTVGAYALHVQCLQDRKFADLFARDESTRSWVNESDRFAVVATQQTERGDVRLELANGYTILIFPAGSRSEAWRLFSSGSDRHLVFPTAATDFAISRRKQVAADTEWEAWLRVVEAPESGSAIEASPPVILSADGTRYRCGRCGRVLVIAEFGALRGFVIRCGNCGRYNEVPL